MIEFEAADDGVYVVSLNRPQRMNALDSAAKQALGDIWRRAEADDQVRAIVIRGKGDRAFCAGSDIKEVQATGKMVSTELLAHAIPGIGVELRKPVIAALHGFTIGMGMTLSMHCDVRIGHPDGKFGFPEVQHGMLSGITAVTLPAMIGEAAALDIMLTARVFGAPEAMRLGLIQRIEPEPLAAALALAGQMAAYSSAAMQITKGLILADRRRRVRDYFDLIKDGREKVTLSKEYTSVVANEAGTGRMRA